MSSVFRPGGLGHSLVSVGHRLDFPYLPLYLGVCCVRVLRLSASSRLACPSGPPRRRRALAWIHEIKHDGFRVIARKDGPRVRLYSRPGNDLTCQFPLARLRSRSCILDGEAVACAETGITRFERLRHHRVDATVFMHAFDLIEARRRGSAP